MAKKNLFLAKKNLFLAKKNLLLAKAQLFKIVFQKNIKNLFYKADLPAFHTHFVDFGGVGIDEKGWKHQNKQNTFQI